eukprot:scaffold249551_cov20-Prasinocladus_malaysianus.AAC.1
MPAMRCAKPEGNEATKLKKRRPNTRSDPLSQLQAFQGEGTMMAMMTLDHRVALIDKACQEANDHTDRECAGCGNEALARAW